MSIIRSLMVTIGADLTGLQKGLNQASKDLKKAGKEITSAGQSLTKGLTMPIVGAAAALTGMAVAAGKGADELLTLSAKTGLATDTLQEMEYAARFIDVEVETMTSSMIKLTKSMDNAQKGTKDQTEAFAALGVEYKNADGTLRNAKDVWADVIDALGKIDNEAERDAISLRLFGRSAQELNPLIKAGSAELKRLGEEAHTVGAVMSDENVNALGNFDDQMQKLQATLKTAGGNIAAAFLPVLEKFTPIIEEKIVPAIQKFAGFISDLINKFNNLSPAQQKLIMGITGFAVAIGPTLTVIGKMTTGIGGLAKTLSGSLKAFTAAGGGIKGIGAAFGALIGPAGIVILVIAAIAALVAIFVHLYKTNDEFRAKVQEIWEKIKEAVTPLIEAIGELVQTVFSAIQSFLTEHGDAIMAVLEAAWNVVWAVLETVINAILALVKIFTALIKGDWEGVWNGIKEYFSAIWNGILNILTAFGDYIIAVIKFWGGVLGGLFKSIWEGIWNGIKWYINLILSGIELFINGAIWAINGLIKGINAIIGAAGGVIGIELKIPTLKDVKIPRLASGAVIPPNDEFMAVLGDQKSGVNIETPLDTMVEAFEMSLDKNGRSVNLFVELDGKTIARVIGQPLVDMIRVKGAVRA